MSKNIAVKADWIHDLMSEEFPSIWLEQNFPGNKKTLIGGFYREWSRGGKDSIPDQVESIAILTSQFDKASTVTKQVIVLGDANICSRNIFEHINCPLLGLYYNTDKCRSKDYERVLLASAKQTAPWLEVRYF